MILPLLDCPSSCSSALSIIIYFKPMQFCWFLKGCQVKTDNRQFVSHNLRYDDGENPHGIFYLYIRETPETETVHKQWQRGSHSSLKEAVILMIKAVVCSEDWFWNTDSLNSRKWTGAFDLLFWRSISSTHKPWRCFTYRVHTKDTESEENTHCH